MQEVVMLSAAIITTALLGASPSTAKSNAAELHPVEQNVVHYTNLERQRHGLPALVVDHGLMASARRHCSWMARSGSLMHTSAAVAENIAMGQHNSLQAVKDWMNSPGHRANMLNGGYSRIGAAAYTSPRGAVFWCVQFLR
jgi:uncharacterized protein YkwD